MNINNSQKVCIIGWQRSGISLCKLLLSLKKKVKVSEIKEREDFSSSLIDQFAREGIEFEFGGHSKKFIKDSELVILSPGIDVNKSSLGIYCRDLNIPCVGEMEFSFWLTDAKIIAITGTNGKTTTAHLTYQVLKQKRKRVFLGGNIGVPFSSFVLDTKKSDLIVLEVSSFQLETILEFRPYVSAFLNIEPDHLDRYDNFSDYFAAKLNIFKNQKKDDWAVLNKNMELLPNIEKGILAKKVYFSNELANENLSCVYRIANIFGLSKIDCLGFFSSFKGLPHRMQLVASRGGIKFINDSKATNPASTVWALRNIKNSIILISGGKDKGLDYSAILPFLGKVKKINLFGESCEKIKASVGRKVKTAISSSLEDAVGLSYQEAKKGDIILFSPMCSSFDMFSNYEERGETFINIVKNLFSEK